MTGRAVGDVVVDLTPEEVDFDYADARFPGEEEAEPLDTRSSFTSRSTGSMAPSIRLLPTAHALAALIGRGWAPILELTCPKVCAAMVLGADAPVDTAYPGGVCPDAGRDPTRRTGIHGLRSLVRRGWQQPYRPGRAEDPQRGGGGHGGAPPVESPCLPRGSRGERVGP